MEFIIGAGVLFLILWCLIVRGILWKFLICIFAFMGFNSYLISNFPNSQAVIMTILGINISWAIFVPSVLILLTLMTTSNKNE